MAISYVLAPEPIWTLINLQGTLAGGGKLYTRRSLDIDQDKPVFKDAGGIVAYTNPIIFDLNGAAPGPFYFQFDPATPNETYFLKATDSQDNELWTIRNFAPGAGGGGGNVTTYISLTNYITNNQFIDHIPDTASPINSTNLVIAPSNHKGFTPALINPVVGTYGVVGPDIRFVKNDTSATDQITFPLFPLASAPMGPGDVTPVDYVRYVSTASTTETYKCFQFPITQKVKNLSNQKMTFIIWAAVTATPVNLKVYTRQYYGTSPSATPESNLTRVQQGTLALTTTWTQFFVSFTVPDVSANSLGTLGAQTNDDALYIQLEMPLNASCDVLFAKPSYYLGTLAQDINFDSYDQIDSIDQTARTGDVKPILTNSSPLGWIQLDDSTIGNEGSGATRHNKDTFQLFKTIWDNVFNNTYAPILTSAGAPSTYGATAVDDFLANKRLTLPRSFGRALANAGNGAGLTPRALGEYTGVESYTLLSTNLPNPLTTNAFTNGFGGGGNIGIGSNAAGGGGIIANTGGNVPFSLMQPTSFMNFIIKL
jgi:hypothetical protein